MKAPLLFFAALLSAVPASAGPKDVSQQALITIPEAIDRINKQLPSVVQTNSNALIIRANRDPHMKKALESGELQQKVEFYIQGFHKGVVDNLKQKQSANPDARVSLTEVSQYKDAFNKDLLALRTAINKEADEVNARDIKDIPAADWKDIIKDTAKDRADVAGMADKNNPGPIAALAVVIDKRLADRANAPDPEKKPDPGHNVPADGGGGPGGPDGSTGGATPNGGAAGDASDRMGLGDYNGARKSLDGAVDGGTADAAAYAMRAGMAMDDGRYGAAVSDARAALAMDPKNQQAVGVLHFSEGRIEGAGGGGGGAAPSERGIAGGGAASEGRASYGGFVGRGGGLAPSAAGPTEAQRAAAARLSAEQAQKAAQNALALHDLSGAMAYVERALAQSPNDPMLLHMRATIHARQHDWAKALDDEKAAFALAPKNGTILRAKGFVELRGGQYKDALASANQLIESNPKDAYGYALRAQAYARLGDREAYAADIRRAAELDPYYREAAARAADVQNPSDSDLLFLFPGEEVPKTAAAPAPGRGRQFSWVVGASIAGGLLLALGLLQTVLAPLKEQVSSVFTRITRTGPTLGALADEPASAGAAAGLIRGQYEITRPIGAGGMGMVYEGTDRSLGRRVAIKKMRDELRADPRERARFVSEAKTVAALHHPNVVDIYAIADEGDDVYLIFEFVDGRTVHELVQAAGKLTPEQTAAIVGAAADALEYAHSRGVIHRDMKPSNVMVDGAGRVKVMDFGIARLAKESMTRYTNTNTVVGTPPYMAPEQEQGQVRRESDVYSLAVCAYEMLTGRLPFAGIGGGMLLNKINMSYAPPSREAGLPAALDGVFARAFQSDPEKRYRAPKEFADALRSALSSGVRA